MKKKNILATIILATLTITTVSINAQEIEVLDDTVVAETTNSSSTNTSEPIIYEHPIGAEVTFNLDGSVKAIKATGQAELLIGDQQDIRMATKKAEMRAKASIAKFLSETISNKETQEEIIDTITSTTAAEKSITRDSVDKMTESISNNANELLKGVVTLVQDVDRDKKQVTVTVGMKESTINAAASLKQSINQPTNAPQKTNVQQNIKTEGRDVRVSNMMDEF